MTTTVTTETVQLNEPTTIPEVPAWLNLDAYCPPAVRQALNNSADELEALLEQFDEIALRAYGALIAQLR